MKQNKGFTLIEMLVVVGMIGVLAAAVLTALGPSRQKARDSRIISGLNQVAALAESKFDGAQYPDVTDADIAKVVTDINSFIPTGGAVTYNKGNGTFAISATLPSTNLPFCVDSAGARKANSTATAGACN